MARGTDEVQTQMDGAVVRLLEVATNAELPLQERFILVVDIFDDGLVTPFLVDLIPEAGGLYQSQLELYVFFRELKCIGAELHFLFRVRARLQVEVGVEQRVH